MQEHFEIGDNPKRNPWGKLPLDITSQRDTYPEAVAKLELSEKPACEVRFHQFKCATTRFGVQAVSILRRNVEKTVESIKSVQHCNESIPLEVFQDNEQHIPKV